MWVGRNATDEGPSVWSVTAFCPLRSILAPIDASTGKTLAAPPGSRFFNCSIFASAVASVPKDMTVLVLALITVRMRVVVRPNSVMTLPSIISGLRNSHSLDRLDCKSSSVTSSMVPSLKTSETLSTSLSLAVRPNHCLTSKRNEAAVWDIPTNFGSSHF